MLQIYELKIIHLAYFLFVGSKIEGLKRNSIASNSSSDTEYFDAYGKFMCLIKIT